MNPVPVPIGILVFLVLGILTLGVLWFSSRTILAVHRSALVELQVRLDEMGKLEKAVGSLNTRTQNGRDNIIALRRQVQELQAEVESLRSSFSPRALTVETSESLPAAVRRRKKKQPKSAFERLASDEEIIEGGDE